MKKYSKNSHSNDLDDLIRKYLEKLHSPPKILTQRLSTWEFMGFVSCEMIWVVYLRKTLTVLYQGGN